MEPALSSDGRLRYSSATLLSLPVLLLPLLMSAVIYRMNLAAGTARDPYLFLFAFVVPPIVFVGYLVRKRLALFRGKSFAFAGTLWGACFGMLYCLLSLGPVGGPPLVAVMRTLPDLIQMHPNDVARAWEYAVLQPIGMALFVVFSYAVHGAVVGSLVGIYCEIVSRSRVTSPSDD